ncbi:MAG TPA: ABC transporter substrate-binding protein, partial [Gammaproteobacteria bacterium]|nr:ABC transporter substrate-binding protein [Gammaproteobacteria bacterium]
MKNIVIGGVPEHFNLPWLDTLQQSGAAHGGWSWQPQPQGTGAMVEAFGTGELDAALLLTEGAVAAVAAGAALDIAANYVDTPLEWGIHVPADSGIDTEAAIRG